MKEHIQSLLQQALATLAAKEAFNCSGATIIVEETKEARHGDFTSNIALVLAKITQHNPKALAERIVSALPASSTIDTVAVAGPGFINFTVTLRSLTEIVPRILSAQSHFGQCGIGRQKRILVEFVSSNPTGPLHVGHGRHAAFGDVVCRLLQAIGFQVTREYYVNDAGRQVDILAVSLWLRYLQRVMPTLIFPANIYQGHYVLVLAEALEKHYGTLFQVPAAIATTLLSDEVAFAQDPEKYIDAVIVGAKQILGERYQTLSQYGLEHIIEDMRQDLTAFGVVFDHWFSEKQVIQTGAIDRLLEQLTANGYTYQAEGALWFRSTQFGDEKDRVLVRSNGERTYFANDIAYHFNKFERQFDLAIDILGADHHGYIARIQGAMQACGVLPERLIVLFNQFVTLYRGKQPVAMSTRVGDFVTLRELRQEVGNDAARFFYLMRKADQPIDFDLDLAKTQSNENPVYYVQYAYARIHSVFKQLAERDIAYDQSRGLAQLASLTETHERLLLKTLLRYADSVVEAGLHYEPQILIQYLRDLAAHFHAYYNAHVFLVEDVDKREARLTLILAVQQVLLNGFQLIGIHAPESM